MFKIFKDFKEVFHALSNYSEEHHVKFFTRERINKIVKQTFKKTYILFILIMITLYFATRPKNIVIINKLDIYLSIYGPQLFIFILLAIFMIIISIIFFIYLTDEYNNHLTNSYKQFVRVMKLFTTSSILIILISLFNLQTYFIDHYLSPQLESCSFYDWYGNELFIGVSEDGECPNLRNIQITFDELTDQNAVIQFGVYGTKPSSIYSTYEYTYTNAKITQIVHHKYHIKQDKLKDLSSKEPYYTIIHTNIYNENSFISYTQINPMTDHSTESYLISQLDETNQEINVSYDQNLSDSNDPITYQFKKQNNMILLDNVYFLNQNSKLQEINELTIKTLTTDQQMITISKKYYPYNVYNSRLPIINLVQTKGTYFTYDITSLDNEVSYIDQFDQDKELTYRHVFKETDFGFKVLHYNYRRNEYHQFIPLSKQSSYYNTLNTQFNLPRSYDYMRFLKDEAYFTYHDGLFLHKNPIFLEY